LFKLLKYLNAYKKETVLGPLLKLLEAFLELLVPLVIAAVIDNAILEKNGSYAVFMCVILILLGFVGLIFSVTAQYFAAKASAGFVKKVREVLFNHIQRFSFSQLDSVGTSTLIARLTSDINQIQNGLNLTLRLLLRSPFVVFGAMIMAFTVDFKSALVFVGVIPVLSVVVFGIMLISIPLFKKVQKCLDGVLLKTRENLSGARVIRAFSMEKQETEEFDSMSDSLENIQLFVGRISALMNPLTYVIINVAIAVLIKVGAIRVESGIITQGSVVALYNYMSQILVELIKLANLIINITKSIACGNRIEEILSTKPSLTGGSIKEIQENSPAIEFNNVSLKYSEGAEPSLSGISFKVNEGETVGIIGGTGSGKSSVINLFSYFYEATEGSVKVFGTDVRQYNTEFLRELIGMVPQKSVLFKGSIRKNIEWGKKDATDEEIYDALKISQAYDFVKEKENCLDYEVSEGGKNFSGGQRQRLCIARAIVKKPKILVLDDSSSALDFATDAALRCAIENIKEKMTVIIVSQRTSSIMKADKILVLDDGCLVGEGTHSELLENCEVYREIYNSQFEEAGTDE